jgi:hypothetical protein
MPSLKKLQELRIGILIPDRGDRPDFLFQCWRMIKAQTLQPYHIELVNDPPKSDACDITFRYRTGYERMKDKGIDLIAFIENDDWYSETYLETMAREWISQGKPDLFGTIYTVYFNLRCWRYFTMWHQDRASAMNTFIKPDLQIHWPVDAEPYTDMHLWMNNVHLSKKIFWPKSHISIGMKHGVGMTGGGMHVNKMDMYYDPQTGKEDAGFLQQTVDPIAFEFYKSLTFSE